MSEYMEQDAERLIQTLESCAVDPMSNGYAEVSKRLLVAAACSLRTLLAHIQRGAVPEHSKQDVRCGCCGYMTYHREHMGCIRAAAPPPDQFRDAAKMMAAPAEVLGETCIDGGKCHHACTDRCFRRACCSPLSGYVGPWEYAQAEVPMPECYVTSGGRDLFSEEQMSTYGDAREAAGYARGRAEAEAKITSSLAATVECEMFETVIYPTIDSALRGEVK